jgi:hypothetical protein
LKFSNFIKWLATAALLLFVIQKSNAQEMWGISNSNFAGNMGIFLNPSSFVAAPYQYEINIIAFDAFAQNAHVYTLENEKSIFHGLTGSVWRDTTKDKDQLQNTFMHTLVIGPSYLRNKNSWGWGFHTAYRSEYSAQDITQHFANAVYHHPQPNDTGVSASLKPFSTAYATWLELGGSYGKIFREDEHNIMKWAANVNLIAGLSGYYFDSKLFDFNTIDTTNTIVHSSDITIGEAVNTTDQSMFGLHGAGLGSSFGLVYIKDINRGAFDCNMSNDRQKKYKYRLGVSLLDVGLIHYFNNSKVSTVTNSSDVIWNGLDSAETHSVKTIDNALVNEIGGTADEKSFDIWLPMALSVQFDYQIKANIFANLSTINRLKLFENQIARGNQINLSGRYERRRFEAALSFSLFEYKKPAVGLGLRYRFFVIGTDRLLETLGLSDANNYDVFFGLKFQFCKKPFSPGPDCPAYRQ